jgi:pyruvate kinase
MIRELEEEFHRPIAILCDLQGPKLRIGQFDGGAAQLVKGGKFILDLDPALGTAERVQLPHPEILRALAPGHTVLIDDGKIRLHVLQASAERATAIVDVAGRISNKKGVNLPDSEIQVSAMTEKDRSDLDASLNAGVDWIGLSFVQRPEDVAEARKIARGRALIMAKIEKPQAIARLDEIMEAISASKCHSRKYPVCKSESRARRAAWGSRW